MTIGILIFLFLGGCSLSFTAGWVYGIRFCSTRRHCIVRQQHDVKDWTGEITKEMQQRLAERENKRKNP
jgi:hypothetical protein